MTDERIRIFLIGMTGQVGRSVLELANQDGDVECIGFDRHELDILNELQVNSVLQKHLPHYVINCAAYTDVEGSETNQDACHALNVQAVEYLAKACHQFNTPLIHLSTDYVFDGKKNTPYLETDMPAPLSIYGLSKFHGEQQLIKHHDKYILLRVSGVFSPWRHNFVKSIMNAAKTRKELRVVSDQQCCPTSAKDIARVILAIIKQLNCGANAWGIYHYVAADVMTWHGFAQAIVSEAKHHCLVVAENIIAITSQEYASKAQRPMNSVLDCQKILNTFGIQQRSWQDELVDVIEQLTKSEVV